MSRKSRKQAKLLLAIAKINDGRHIIEGEDDGIRLGLSVSGLLAEGTTTRHAKMMVVLSDGHAQQAILYLLASMRPRSRNSLIRAIQREGLRPPVFSARPSKRG